jgi:hypothetical protein
MIKIKLFVIGHEYDNVFPKYIGVGSSPQPLHALSLKTTTFGIFFTWLRNKFVLVGASYSTVN